MRITLAAVGRGKPGPVRDVYQHYIKRLNWHFDLREVEERKALPPAQLKRREAEMLLDAIPKGAALVALDERGKNLSSAEFAQMIGQWRDNSVQDIAFVIGGADGLEERVRSAATRSISFGRMTWPHMMVRALLAEQLYRAQSILAGHPYHRE
ncbi:23S rRNA (pseudouridine(1915)-N(3))-methyltransferase RlmH [Denitrobaculum tricleocarpae]|uniref:Ribosomal RNA large subunit methyltransferase H n=1 Tax=Denitrobaculum tricleocarpae TaxID=2591009 RepID=A0A545TQQ3_9PROT|nr:23S rRNA (pseudouridine(1915)-N(3))-methyltransferase RlmH [Denitrobaculum tricleocarpae]TQV79555.1 23S rRNA (pseudouridine(1915)-N(3))-methyltransferase RlmH [Denitrobaculum tricleocarpae]